MAWPDMQLGPYPPQFGRRRPIYPHRHNARLPLLHHDCGHCLGHLPYLPPVTWADRPTPRRHLPWHEDCSWCEFWSEFQLYFGPTDPLSYEVAHMVAAIDGFFHRDGWGWRAPPPRRVGREIRMLASFLWMAAELDGCRRSWRKEVLWQMAEGLVEMAERVAVEGVFGGY
ncbi:hypothetical protein K490DRAFT_61986 [Saccharata proteae CBS 121410]|uniref:Uncharacterized protein n=1 Tax=Saccharata proteae CBS 121410 TaxID=1314787 RepID=A0A9P4HZB9_9PEZI|nr:hypothetical protein K490DRAFT_61986 [Saccharata proteae CBS 121410]